MATRAGIKVTDGDTTAWFYKHWDGYPEGTMPLLEKFMDWVKAGTIRDNVPQGAPWLIIIGHKEYSKYQDEGWKVGHIELADRTVTKWGIEYMYTVDLAKKTIKYRSVK